MRTTTEAFEALQALVETASDLDCCSCLERSWYGPEHDSQCPLTYTGRAKEAIRFLKRRLELQ